MYAVIRAGGKQAKVHEGDIIDVERIKGSDKVSYTPLLIVGDDGSVIADRKVLSKASVTAKILGESAGPKIDIFKYKNKTGYRRRQGHRQKYTTIEVTKIKTAPAKKKAPAAADEDTKVPKAEAKAKPKASTEAKAKPKASTKAKAKPKASAKPTGEDSEKE
jgi:large subunit ribosomal protein L21